MLKDSDEFTTNNPFCLLKKTAYMLILYYLSPFKFWQLLLWPLQVYLKDENIPSDNDPSNTFSTNLHIKHSTYPFPLVTINRIMMLVKALTSVFILKYGRVRIRSLYLSKQNPHRLFELSASSVLVLLRRIPSPSTLHVNNLQGGCGSPYLIVSFGCNQIYNCHIFRPFGLMQILFLLALVYL